MTHLLDVVTIYVVLTLVGVEFSVAAFANPAAARLAASAQGEMLSRLAHVLGKVMPVWYPMAGILLLLETWLHWHADARGFLVAADAIWVIASVASLLFLVPLNTQIAKGSADWQQLHRVWDRRHRLRTAALALAALLLTSALTHRS